MLNSRCSSRLVVVITRWAPPSVKAQSRASSIVIGVAERGVQLPFTTFARDLLRGADASGNPVPGTLALLSVIEPFSIGFASFDGPGTPGEPVLRLVLTIGPPVELP